MVRGIHDEDVLAAFARVPRQDFLAPEQRHAAYDDRPLPTQAGQTISQPLVVAHMLQALALRSDDRALEVGTGSGYAAAVLSRLVARVDTVERISSLAEQATKALEGGGYANVRVHFADGIEGLKPYGPFDAILVSAAVEQVPEALLDQLALGGRLVAPLGSVESQRLTLVRRGTDSTESRSDLGPVRFVPLLPGVD